MLISVIIPTYNRFRTLSRAINSVLEQTYQNFELIIVDDGSTDETSSLINELNDARIKYIKHRSNYGQNAALNSGITICNGQLVTFCDSDDQMLPFFIEKLIDKFNQDPDISVAYGQMFHYNSIHNTGKIAFNFWAEGYIYDVVLAQGFMAHMGALMVKTECFKTTGLFDINFTSHQDDDFCFKLAKTFKVGLVSEPLSVAFNEGLGDRVTDNNLNYCAGWERLLNKYENEITLNVGNAFFVNHLIKAAELRMNISDFQGAISHLQKSIRLLNKYENVSGKLANINPSKIDSERKIIYLYNKILSLIS